MIEILQIIGGAYSEVEFDFGKSLDSLRGALKCNQRKERVKATLSSMALRESTDCDLKIKLIIPQSLVNKKEIRENSKRVVKIVNIDLDKVGSVMDLKRYIEENLENVIDTYNLPEESEGIQYMGIPSIGTLKGIKDGKDIVLRYDGDTNTIHFLLFAELVKDFIVGKEKSFGAIGDISTGLNLYNFPLIEAIRSFNVFTKLYSLLQYNGVGDYATFISSCDPIFRGSSIPPYRVTFSKIDVKAFFSLPMRNRERFTKPHLWFKYNPLEHKIGNKWKRNINVEWKCLGKRCSEILNTAFVLLRMSFNAIEKNIPLFFYYINEKDLFSCATNPENIKILSDPDNIDKLILELIDLMIRELNKYIIKKDDSNIYHIRYTKLKDKAPINVIYSLAMLRSIMKFYRDEIYSKQRESQFPSFEEIKSTFNHLYGTLNLELNIAYLNRELTKLEYEIKKHKKENNQSYNKIQTDKKNTYREFVFCDEINEKKENKPNGKRTDGNNEDNDENNHNEYVKGSDVRRNFFAHSGMSKTVTCIDKDNKIKWIRSRLKDICRWLNT